MQMCLEIIGKMPKYGVTPNERTYGILIETWAKSGLVQNIKSTLTNMVQHGILPSPTTYTNYLEGLIIGNEINEAMATHAKLYKAVRFDTNSYNRLIQALADRGHIANAQIIYHRMQEQHIPLNLGSYIAILSVRNKDKKTINSQLPRHELQMEIRFYVTLLRLLLLRNKFTTRYLPFLGFKLIILIILSINCTCYNRFCKLAQTLRKKIWK